MTVSNYVQTLVRPHRDAFRGKYGADLEHDVFALFSVLHSFPSADDQLTATYRMCALAVLEDKSRPVREDRAYELAMSQLELHKRSLASMTDSIFVCPKCKSKKCSYVEKQTRSADEAMTVFVTCHACSHKFKR